MQLYVQELNELESRRGRKPLDVSNLVYWFKNARAAYKRAETRTTSQHDSSGADAWPMASSGVADDSSDAEGAREASANERNEHDDASSCYDDRAVKNEPVQRDADDLSPQRDAADAQHDSMTTNAEADDSDADASSDASDSDEDYAENLSVSKHYDDAKCSASPSVAQSDYAAAVTGYPAFPLAGFNSQLSPHGLVYMTSPYLQGIGPSLLHASSSGAHLQTPGSSGTSDDRRKRNRTFIDPVTEVPRLEHWFSLNTHPSHSLVLRYTDELNRQPYRLKFPKLEPKNVQFWFKNRRAKCKRLKLSL